MKNKKATYINPYLGGFLLGLLLLATLFIGGHGLGASGGIKDLTVAFTALVAPSWADGHHFFGQLTGSIWKSWIVIMVIGLFTGSFISGVVSRNLKFTLEKGSHIGRSLRLMLAVCGGLLFGIGSQLGRGCTSGAALNGMAVLSASGIITMLAIFGTGFAFAFLFKKFWL